MLQSGNFRVGEFWKREKAEPLAFSISSATSGGDEKDVVQVKPTSEKWRRRGSKIVDHLL